MKGSGAKQEGQRDSITAFAAKRQLQPNAVTLGSWNYKHLAGTTAEMPTALDIGELPPLEVYDGSGAYRYKNPLHAERAAEMARQALELDFKRFEAASGVFATEAQIASMSGQDHSVTAGGDIQQTAAFTYSSVSGNTTSLYVHDGGIKMFAANGPVSIRAHTDTMQLLADQELTVTSVNEEILIEARDCVEIFDGESSLTIKGMDITYLLPGLYSAPQSTHEFMAAGSSEPVLPALPVGTTKEPPLELELNYQYDDLTPVVGAPYKVTYESGEVFEGKLDASGRALIQDVPKGKYRVELGEDERPWAPPPLPPDEAPFRKSDVQAMGRDILERALEREEPHDTGPGADQQEGE